jgi:hypothetical protein
MRENFSGKTKPIGALESIACENLRSQFGGEMDGRRLAPWEGMAGLGLDRVGAGMLINLVVEWRQNAGWRVQRTFSPALAWDVTAHGRQDDLTGPLQQQQ